MFDTLESKGKILSFQSLLVRDLRRGVLPIVRFEPITPMIAYRPIKMRQLVSQVRKLTWAQLRIAFARNLRIS